MFDEDVVDHIAKVLELLDLIKIHGVDSHRLRMKVFPLLLADDARQWWINEREGKITTWEELVEKFFCKFYPESHDGEDEMLDEGDNWGIDPLESIS
ncbi:zinc finger, CCHC-type containing protein [Tanacetum coccineum]